MTMLRYYVDELDRLVQQAAHRGMQSTEFVSGLHCAMQKISLLLVGTTNHDFLNADYILTEAIDDYNKHPLPGVTEIGRLVGEYRGAATLADATLAK